MFASGTKSSGAFASRFSVYRNTTQSIEPSTWTTLTWTAKAYDGLGEVDIVTNHRFVAAATGYYHFTASLNMYLLDADKTAAIRLNINGETQGRSGSQGMAASSYGENWTHCHIDADVYVQAGEYVVVEGFQSDSSAKNSAGRIRHFMGHRLA